MIILMCFLEVHDSWWWTKESRYCITAKNDQKRNTCVIILWTPVIGISLWPSFYVPCSPGRVHLFRLNSNISRHYFKFICFFLIQKTPYPVHQQDPWSRLHGTPTLASIRREVWYSEPAVKMLIWYFPPPPPLLCFPICFLLSFTIWCQIFLPLKCTTSICIVSTYTTCCKVLYCLWEQVIIYFHCQFYFQIGNLYIYL